MPIGGNPKTCPHKSTRVVQKGKQCAEICNDCGTTIRQWLDPKGK